jgi:5-(carboxyamino)imidazole ribonucleotide synthase
MSDGPYEILPPATLGVMGGGQLGRFFVHAAQDLGYRSWVLDPDPDSPAGRVADRHLVAAYDDESALDELGGACAAVTTEFENVPTESLARLEEHTVVRPGPHAVAVCQDRAREKGFLNENGFATAPYLTIEDASAFVEIPPTLFPAVLKTATLGYDGKGQVRVSDAAGARDAFETLGSRPCVLEELVPLSGEVAVVLARDARGAVETFGAVTTVHEDGILVRASLGDVEPELSSRARDAAARIAEALSYVGVLAVEFFVVDGALLVNELAPRPHNSGHLTLDAHNLSQFDYQVRTLCGLPLVPAIPHGDAVMVNLLGDLWFSAAAGAEDDLEEEPPWSSLLSAPELHLHLYGKATPRRGRKMGHFTLVGGSAAALHRQADGGDALLRGRVTPAGALPPTPPTTAST